MPAHAAILSAMVGLLALASPPAGGRTPSPVVPEDIYSLETLETLEVSPDSRTLAYVVETYSRLDDALKQTLFLAPSVGGEGRAVGDEKVNRSSPRFSPDGRRLAFLADAGGGARLFVARGDGRHARPLTKAGFSVGAYDFSPDGRSIVFVRRDPAVPGKPDDDPFVITRSLIQRDGEGFLTSRRDHLWVVAVDTGLSRQLTSGPYDDYDPRWSPDGRWIAFVSNRTEDPDTNDDTDVFLVRPDGGDLHAIASNPGPDDTPRWSHRGDRIAFIGGRRPNDSGQARPLMAVAVAGGAPVDLAVGLSTRPAADAYQVSYTTPWGALWSPDDSTIYCTFEHHGDSFLAAIPSGGGPIREILGGRREVETVRLSRDGRRFFLSLGDATHPSEIHTMASDGSELKRLSHLNDPFLEHAKLSVPETVEATNSDGDHVESWLYPPIDLDPAKRYPLILYIHGGPDGYDGDYFDSDLENQVFPGKGFAVLRVNYRGSTSYGERFSRAPWGDWHRREYEDLMVSLDAALERNKWLDKDRLGVGGWSYGGIMTLWTVGHTDRFKVGVPERFSFDYPSIFGEDQWFSLYLEQLGDPYKEESKYRRLSPSTYLPRVKTPLYLIGNEKDANCPLPQVMQAYQRLRLLGQKPELVVYPGEPHTLGRPSHLVDRLNRLVAWFSRHLTL